MQSFIFRYLLLALGLIGFQIADAQVSYFHYYNANYTWYEGSWGAIFGGPPCIQGGDFISRTYYHVVGEDSLNGNWWYQVHSDHIGEEQCFGGPTTVFGPNPFTGIAFRIREDADGRVWKLNYQGVEKMLYDFGGPFVVGDTLWMDDYQKPCKIGSIDSVYFGPEGRARYWCDCDPPVLDQTPQYVVEGVGASVGFDNFYELCANIFDARSYTICAKHEGFTVLVDSTSICGNPPHVVVGVDDQRSTAVEIHWSDVSETLAFGSADGLAGKWRVIDAAGRVLRVGTLTERKVALPGLAAGVYLVSWECEDGSHGAERFVRW